MPKNPSVLHIGKAEDMIWKGECAQWYMEFDGSKILCWVSEQAISDHYQDTFGPNPNAEQCLELAKTNFDDLSDKVSQRIYHGQREEDGSVLITTQNF